DTQPDPLGGVGDADPQEDDALAGQERAGPRVAHRAPAQREHAGVGGEGVDDGGALPRPELLLALVDEDVLHGLAGHRLDVLVGVAEADPPCLGEQAADRGLARPHGPHQHHPWAHWVARGWEPTGGGLNTTGPWYPPTSLALQPRGSGRLPRDRGIRQRTISTPVPVTGTSAHPGSPVRCAGSRRRSRRRTSPARPRPAPARPS